MTSPVAKEYKFYLSIYIFIIEERMSVHNFEVRLEERLRKKAFAHYDCHSMIVDFGCPSKYRILQERKNTTTGASAASLVSNHQVQPPQVYNKNNNNHNKQQMGAQTNLHSNNNYNFQSNDKNHLISGEKNTCDQQQHNNNNNLAQHINGNNTNTSNLDTNNTDLGDVRQNDLVLTCPMFRNELGGEEERIVCLNKLTDRKQVNASSGELHKPSFVGGISILETIASSQIINNPVIGDHTLASQSSQCQLMKTTCPYQRNLQCNPVIDYADMGATYYRHYFFGRDHQNWFGHSESYGPLAISIRKEPLAPHHNRYGSSDSTNNHHITNNHNNHHHHQHHHQPNQQNNNNNSSSNTSNNANEQKYRYRIIIRTSELAALRGSVYEDCIPNLSHRTSSKEVLEYLLAKSDIPLNKLRLGAPNADEKLLNLDEHKLTKNFKIGVLYCKAGQSTEEEFYNNEHSGPLFDEFLSCIGEKVRLQGFNKYRGGLDVKTDSTGQYSVFTTYQDCEVMFHVSTMLPYSANNRQQLSRKRHIGNDIVTIVFQEEGAAPFTPKTIRSQFQHVFIIVKALNPPQLADGSFDYTAPRHYAVAVSRSKEMPPFGPPIPEGGVFLKSQQFKNFLLAKIINAENAAHKYCEKFRTMGQRTRLGLLSDLTQDYVTNTTLNDFSGSSTSGPSDAVKIISSLFGGKKRSQRRYANFNGHSDIQGAIVWDVQVKDFGQSNKIVDCILGISSSYLVVIEQSTKELLYATPVEAILGWTSNPAWIKIFCHQAECLLIQIKDPDVDEICEIVTRLKAITTGCETRELTLRRKNSQNSLGFDIQPDGIVVRVDAGSIAWQTHLVPGSRLVEICKTSTATLSYNQMMEYIRTSAVVTLTVLPPNADGTYRRGCLGQSCAHQPIISRPSSTFSSNASTGNGAAHFTSSPNGITAATNNATSKPKRRVPTTSLMTLV